MTDRITKKRTRHSYMEIKNGVNLNWAMDKYKMMLDREVSRTGYTDNYVVHESCKLLWSIPPIRRKAFE